MFKLNIIFKKSLFKVLLILFYLNSDLIEDFLNNC